MKTLFTLLCALAFASFARATVVVTNVDFGSSKDSCTGKGICKSKTTTSGESVQATWELSQDQRTLTLTMTESQITEVPDEIMADMQAGRFIQPAELPVDPSVCQSLQAAGCLVILQGTHPVTYSAQLYRIRFAVRAD